jgi:hypothetical protein
MKIEPPRLRVRTALGIGIGAVWVFHGLYSKLLDGIPRHRQIVGRILGEEFAEPATLAVGALEIVLGVWVFTGRRRRACALVQTLTLVGMNALEILLAPDLLLSAVGMVGLNAVFLALVWWWAATDASPPATHRTR